MRAFTTVLLLLFSIQAHAFENYFSNRYTPIPPGCVTQTQLLQSFNSSGTQTLVSGTIDSVSMTGNSHKLNVNVWRIGCAVEGRSVLLVDFGVDQSGTLECVYIPRIDAKLADGTLKDFRVTDEPNSWSDGEELGFVCEGDTRRFFLDTFTPYSVNFEQSKVISTIEYNSNFTIRFKNVLGDLFTSPISAYQNNLGESSQAISGRLSGNWGNSGAKDQGFLISFNELASATNVVFVSWYTFDKDGKQLWMVGNANYEIGDRAVQMPLQVVSGGTFLGDKTATRTSAGSISLTVKSCNEIGMEYNLNNIGLGQGSKTLVRIVSLEIAGYVCADRLTRIEHENDY